MGRWQKLALLGAALLVAGWLATQQDGSDVSPAVQPSAAAGPPAASAASAGQDSRPSALAAVGAEALTPPAARAAAVTPPAVRPSPQSAAQLNEEANLGLTTRLSGEQRITLDQRERTILGARVVSADEGAQTLVLSRDEASGQIEYWQPALRFALRPGLDAEAFLRSQPRLRRLFVNADYVDVAVDPGDLAAAFRALASDPAVTGVRLLPLRPKVVAR